MNMQLYPSSDFADIAERARKRVASICPEAMVEEVGSTSIRGALTKGDVDIFVGVSQAEFEPSNAVLCTHGFLPKVDTLQTNELRMLVSSDKEIDLACQVVILGSQYDFFRAFRDRLNNDIALVQAYNALKLKHLDLPYEQYRDAKAAFIERVLS
ncbi:GrpB family protein [Halioglobus japonicus]|uniref:GrpB family protein n=1 Tax=Halioglobus japonicus TaxID=930805 RepID=A0AAP8MGY9_9GAMM|nr:GrpB family protein [Halioglobus japonicus]PLW87636.1 hypothetical protein C0029_03395 [Halioglobus japonicus]